METNNTGKEKVEVVKIKESKKQRYLYAFIYGILGLLAGFLEYYFVLFLALPIYFISFLDTMHAMYEGYSGVENLAEPIINLVATLIAVALFFFITRYGFVYGKKRDVNNIPAPKYLVLALVIEILIFITPAYFLIKELLIVIK